MIASNALDVRDFALGERLPAQAFAPANSAELAGILRACDAEGRAVVLFGGGTLQALANVPQRYDVALSLARLASVVEHSPHDLTIAVEAGLSVADFEVALAEHAQFVPLDAPRASLATVGGTLAGGWLGPRRALYGRPRDFVIGASVVLADGTFAKSGGMVVKNSTGYDVTKLYLGSHGTLAALVRVNFKTLPLPQQRRLAIAALPEGTRARTLEHLASLEIEPAAALLVRGFAREIEGPAGADGRIVLLYEGSEQLIERATRDLRSTLGAAGLPETRLLDREASNAFAHILDAYVTLVANRSASYRCGGHGGDTGARRELLAAAARAARLQLETIEDVQTGDVIARVVAPLPAGFGEHLLEFQRGLRRSLPATRLLAAPAAVRALLDGWGKPPPSLAAMRALKTQFDPRGTLAPGRYVGGI